MSQLISPETVCPRCQAPLSAADLACPACGLFVHLSRLQELSKEAQSLEPHDAAAAAEAWEDCLTLIPPDSQQAAMLRQRVGALRARAAMSDGNPQVIYAGATERGGLFAPAATTGGAILRTVASMLISIWAYSYFFGAKFAAGFVVLILVHEMGHVIALRFYGVRASPPIFVPFMGAVITVPSMRNCQEEAIVGIAGPVLGTVGSLACFALYHASGQPILLDLSFWGFAINLFNLLPVPPLDGGRVMAAVSRWVWPLGLIGLVALFLADFLQDGHINYILIFVLVFAAPRLWRALHRVDHSIEYYQIAKSASWAIGTAYVLLGGVLFGMFYFAQTLGAQ